MKMENLDLSWDCDSIITNTLSQGLHNRQQPMRNARTLKELMPTKDLTLLDLYERERQLAAREAAAIRLEERGRQQEIAAREAALFGRETALAMKERELSLSEREQAVQDSDICLKEKETKLNIAKHKLTELENEFYRKTQQEITLLTTREKELHAKDEELQKKEHELLIMKNILNEESNKIEKLQKEMKVKEESLNMTQRDIEKRESDVEKREQDVEKKEKQFEEQEKHNRINNEAIQQEFETTELSFQEKTLNLKKMESSIIFREKELDDRRLEIQRELEKQDNILKNTANIMAKKEEEFKKLERDTMERIEAQEEEFKLWEIELQQQEIKIQEHTQNLEKHKGDVLRREEVIVAQNQQLLLWQKQLQTRAHSLNEQAEAQEEHLRVILEKEKIFDELKAILEQKEQQYKMLVQCKEHEFDVREQNLQKIISDLLNSETKKENIWHSDIIALSKKVSPLLHENYGNSAQSSRLTEKVFSDHFSSQYATTKNQQNVKQKLNFKSSEETNVKPGAERECVNSTQNIKQREKIQESDTKIAQSANKTSLKTLQNKYFSLGSQSFEDLAIEETPVKQVISIPHFLIPDISRYNDCALSEEQIKLLDQIKNNTFKGEKNISMPNSPTRILNIKHENFRNINKKILQQSFSQLEKARESTNFKKHYFNQEVQEQSCNPSHLKHNTVDIAMPEKQLSKLLKSNETIFYPSQIQTKSRSTSCNDLREALDVDLNEQNTLHGATKGYRIEMVRSLVERHGANIDGRDPDGRTALHWAAELGHLALVQYLGGEMGASVDVQTNSGLTALHLAALEGRLDVVQYLVEILGANTEARDANGETALHLAAGAGWLEVVKYISGVKASQANRTFTLTNVPKIEIENVF